MPRDNKRKSGGRNANTYAGNFQFLEMRVLQSDKDKFSKWSQDKTNDSVDLLASLTNSGYKVSLSWSDYHDCYTASLTCTDKENHNYGWIVTSKSDDLWDAVMLMLYKHYVMARDEQWPIGIVEDSWG